MVVSLKSRSIEAGLAVTRSRAAEKWLRGRGAGHVLFKICSTFDSTDAGNIGPVMDALRADSGDAIVLVTPAFPETGRTVYQGNLFVGAVPLNESPLKDHPLNPMHDSNLVRVLARQSKTKVGLVDLADAVARRGCRSRAARRSRRQGHSAPPSSTPCSTAIWKPSASWRWIIACRSAPPASGSGLPGRWSLPAKVKSGAASAIAGAAVGGPAACLAGSCSQATLQQIANAEKTMPVLHLDPDRDHRRARTKRGARWPGRSERISGGPILIASSSTPDQVAALQSRHGRDAAGHAIEQAMADIAEGLVRVGRAATGGRRW